ncbi:MAG: hypothetical protein KDE27_24730, partial [Planctomycetes bacterium]|nr:hypothetical protein [Planctomycetota bacterium]
MRDCGPVDDDDERTSEWVSLWPNGRRAAAGSYERGQRVRVWYFHDPYGRIVETVDYAAENPTARPIPREQWRPLSVDDLRAGLIGLTTVGEVVDRYASAGESERRALREELAKAPPEALGVPFTIAASLAPADRVPWLELMAAMPMPDRMPVRELVAWLAAPACAAAAEQVLAAWSLRYRSEWEPLLTSGAEGGADGPALNALGAKARAALPELRRRFFERGARALQGADLNRILGLETDSPATPWFDELDHADAAHRAFAAQVLAGLVFARNVSAGRVPPATVVRRLADPSPRVVEAASGLLFCLTSREQSAFDSVLDQLAESPVTRARVAAACRLAALGRSADADRILRRVAATAPESLDWFDGWNVLAQHTAEPAAVRELLFTELSRGQWRLDALQRVAGDDPRVMELLVANAIAPRADLLPPASLQRVRERLLGRLEDPATGASERTKVFFALVRIADEFGRAAVAWGLDADDAKLRQF